MGRYRITGVLGAGGMGRVLLGEAPDGRRAAIKLVHPELVESEGFRARFRREVALAAQAPPGWTAAFLDADPDAAQPWLATAYLDAPTLHDEIARAGTLSADRAADLGVGMASALAALHARGLVHRDLKPSNVLLTGGGPRLIDFGISRAIDGTALTATGQVIGTPEYLSPEQITGTPRAGTAADLFALGSLLVFVTSGRTPFGGGGTAAVLSRVVHGEPDLPPGLGRIEPVVRMLLDKDPAARPTAERTAELLAGGLPAGPPEEGRTVLLHRPPDGAVPAPGGTPGPAGTAPGQSGTTGAAAGPAGTPGTAPGPAGRPSAAPGSAGTPGTAPGPAGTPGAAPGPGGTPGPDRAASAAGAARTGPDGTRVADGPPWTGTPSPYGDRAPGPIQGPLPPPTLLGAPPATAEPWRRRRWPLVAGGIAVVLALLVVAVPVLLWGSGGSPAEGTSAGPGPSTTAPPPPPPPSTTAPAPTTPAGDTADLLAGATVVDTSQEVRYVDPSGALRFSSPSGNIACALEPFEVRCDVLERTWEVPPVPASCQQAYGTGTRLAGAAAGELTCVGDTIADPSLPVLEFDRALRSDEITCVSRMTGVECRNTTTGHGIAVARASYRVY
ncbi:Serine/threonine-protein kinase AfsK [Pseudonocardia autotrophica]|uniref:Serine/threonine-protein kinase AfsK n=1 Tax=Pseudonocardia autotrophica TaxID=2074 RepID=A0A1Y2MSP9_PSEAH|nr:Serine/threonine-protein kinase AfsK [Pseudonocardia autotrophica]